MKLTSSFLFSIIIMLTAVRMISAQQPIELGTIDWIRNFDQAIIKSKAEHKPIFILFQEVPGCATCRNYGEQVLSHPLVVEAIETLFIPVAIFNNKKGTDAAVLTFFHEPAWNNPVVRIVDPDRKDLIPRLAGNYQLHGVVEAMIAALDIQSLNVPEYLKILEFESKPDTQLHEVFFSMSCFWTGEKIYGAIDGVRETEAGYMAGKEVVRVQYRPDKISLSNLVKKGRVAFCADNIYLKDKPSQSDIRGLEDSRLHEASNFRPDKETKYYLSQTQYRFIPMTTLQATRINSLIGRNLSVNHLLSPRQLKLLKFVMENPDTKFRNVIGTPIKQAWSGIVNYL